MYVYIYIYIYICITVRLLHPRCENSQDQKTFVAASVNNQTCNYDA